MSKHYDFSKARPNPYAKLLKRPVTIRLDSTSVAYFKRLAKDADSLARPQGLLRISVIPAVKQLVQGAAAPVP